VFVSPVDSRCRGFSSPIAGFGSGSFGKWVATLVSVTSERTSMRCPHLRHFMRTVRPATFSSAI
jgi:hypothetical protein